MTQVRPVSSLERLICDRMFDSEAVGSVVHRTGKLEGFDAWSCDELAQSAPYGLRHSALRSPQEASERMPEKIWAVTMRMAKAPRIAPICASIRNSASDCDKAAQTRAGRTTGRQGLDSGHALQHRMWHGTCLSTVISRSGQPFLSLHSQQTPSPSGSSAPYPTMSGQ